MEKLQAKDILIKDANLKAVRFNDSNITIIKLIEETNQKQADVLKLKEIDQEKLNMVIQL